MNREFPLLFRLTVTLLFIFLFVFGLIAAKDILVPIAFATLLAFLLYPVANFFEKRGVPRILANLLAILLGVIFLGFAMFLIYEQLNNFVGDFPVLRKQAIANLQMVTSYIESEFGVSTREQYTWIREFITNAFSAGNETYNLIFNSTARTVAKIAVLPVFVFFLLYYRNKYKEFILKLTNEDNHGKTSQIIKEISTVVQHYMGGITTVVLILCVLNTLGLLIVGIKYTLLLGILSAFMNYIPYFGTLIGGSLPLAVAIITEDSPKYAIGVIILFLIIQFLENNILTPNIVGGNVKINPFFVILSIIVGGLIWGLAGMFIILPFVAMIKIVCENIESLHPYAFLLGTEGTEKHALTWEKIKNLFPRRKR